MIKNRIHKEFKKAQERGWDKIYVFVDFHEVIMAPDYQSQVPNIEYYPFAKEFLQHLSARKDVCLIAWTCSNPKQINNYYEVMEKDGIKFDYTNENPEVTTDSRCGHYEKKPYYNLIFDDKSGFEPSEFEEVIETFKLYNLI